MQSIIDDDFRLKEIFKTALVEVLEERKDLVNAILNEILEDMALSRAIDEAENEPRVSREAIIEVLESAN